jgi:hypothetical protein
MNERQKGRCEFVVARGDTPEVLDASEEAFDQIAVSVEMAIEAALGKTIGAGRNHGLRAGGFDCCNEVVGVVSLVRDDSLRGQVLDGLGRTFDVGNLACGENHPQRIAQGIHGDMQLGGQPTPRSTDFLATRFFLAPAEC